MYICMFMYVFTCTAHKQMLPQGIFIYLYKYLHAHHTNRCFLEKNGTPRQGNVAPTSREFYIYM